jgi:hypothetical protein
LLLFRPSSACEGAASVGPLNNGHSMDSDIRKGFVGKT